MSVVEEIVAEEFKDLERTLNYFGMLEILKNHYGDGCIYLPEGASSDLIAVAKQYGYVNEEGYLTRQGRKLVTEHRESKAS